MLKWNPHLTIRENHIDSREGVQLSDALNKRRMLVSKETMLDAIVNADSDGTSPCVEALVRERVLAKEWPSDDLLSEGVAHWVQRNWGLALPYYLWTRRDKFLDEGHDYEEIRCSALRQMLEEEAVPLPSPIPEADQVDLGSIASIPELLSVGQVLSKRVTTQFFHEQKSIDASTLGGLLRNGFSVSQRYHVPDIEEHIHNLLHGVGFAFDAYLAIFNIQDLEPGLYFYSISQDRLRLERKGNFRSEVCAGLIGHQQALTASCTIFLTVDFRRFQWRYRHERALRNLYVDVGRMAQYLILVATAYGVKNHLTPAAVDSQLADLLQLDPERHQVFYSITLGL